MYFSEDIPFELISSRTSVVVHPERAMMEINIIAILGILFFTIIYYHGNVYKFGKMAKFYLLYHINKVDMTHSSVWNENNKN